jgi:hypothetical protein
MRSLALMFSLFMAANVMAFDSSFDSVGMGINPIHPMNHLNPANPFYGDWGEDRPPTTEEVVAKCDETQDRSEFCEKARADLKKEEVRRAFKAEVSNAVAYLENNPVSDTVCAERYTKEVCQAASDHIQEATVLKWIFAGFPMALILLIIGSVVLPKFRR